MKDSRDRINDTLEYLRRSGMAELAGHIVQTVGLAALNMISPELSLGSRIFHTDASTEKRRAMRALLLCQRVYFSTYWPQYMGLQAALQPVDSLPAHWKDYSMQYWYPQQETQIREGIRAFTVTEDAAIRLQEAALAGMPARPTATGMLSLTRNTNPFPGRESCYGAVMTWLFKAGLVSFRWYMKYGGASNQQSLTEAFGRGRIIWPASRQFAHDDSLPYVLPGHIVHLYVNTPWSWTGHWLVSLGLNGLACGCNNDSTDGTPNNYSNACSLDNQFYHGYKARLPNSEVYNAGIAEVFDPRFLPNRI